MYRSTSDNKQQYQPTDDTGTGTYTRTGTSSSIVLSGILFSRSVRSAFACFTLASVQVPVQQVQRTSLPSSSPSSFLSTSISTLTSPNTTPIIVRVQFKNNVQELRSFCRKRYKIGDRVEVLCTDTDNHNSTGISTITTGLGGWESINRSSQGDKHNDGQNEKEQRWSQQPRWVINLSSVSDAQKSITVSTPRAWTAKECQKYQIKYLPSNKREKQKLKQQQQQQQPKQKIQRKDIIENNSNLVSSTYTDTVTMSNGTSYFDDITPKRQSNQYRYESSSKPDKETKDNHHGGGREKRLQAKVLAQFLMKIIAAKLSYNKNQSNEKKNQATRSTIAATSIASTMESVTTSAWNGDGATPGNHSRVMSAESIQEIRQQQTVRDWLNRGGGVLDVAGGCGHVSMELGMNGILSTVVDTRSTVGKLPKRDRKVWKRCLKTLTSTSSSLNDGSDNDGNDNGDGNKLKQQKRWQQPQKVEADDKEKKREDGEKDQMHNRTNDEIEHYHGFCQLIIPPPLVVPFRIKRAWFGSKPDNYDTTFRHPDKESVPIVVASTNSTGTTTTTSLNYDNYDCDAEASTSVIKLSASTIVGLHPDEATAEIVKQAVRHRIPFLVVPCCVFARLFPKRKTKNGNNVSTYENLLDYLQEMDDSIQRTVLPFDGKNVALWSIFQDGENSMK